jgi:hypothetical protein
MHDREVRKTFNPTACINGPIVIIRAFTYATDTSKTFSTQAHISHIARFEMI